MEGDQQLSAAVMIGGNSYKATIDTGQRQASLAKNWRTILLL